MAKFNFALQNIFNIKKKLEEQKKIELGNLIQQLEEQKRKVETLQNEMLMKKKQYMSSPKVGVQAAELAKYSQVYSYYSKLIQQEQLETKKCQLKVDAKQKELLEAVQERQIYEKLREKAYANYLEEEKMAENKLIDEVVAFKYHDH